MDPLQTPFRTPCRGGLRRLSPPRGAGWETEDICILRAKKSRLCERLRYLCAETSDDYVEVIDTSGTSITCSSRATPSLQCSRRAQGRPIGLAKAAPLNYSPTTPGGSRNPYVPKSSRESGRKAPGIVVARKFCDRLRTHNVQISNLLECRWQSE